MPEIKRQSPLHPSLLDDWSGPDATFHARTVQLWEIGPRRYFVVRSRNLDALAASVSELWQTQLPLNPNTSHPFSNGRVLWWSPDEWLVYLEEAGGAPRTPLSLAGGHVVEQTGGLVTIGLKGKDARTLLSAGCWLDLHPSEFPRDTVAQTLVAKANATIVMTDDAPAYELVVRRSFAPYLWRWLCRSASLLG